MHSVTQPPSTALILIVDDDRDLRLMLRRILEQAGYDVIEAPDGEQALNMYKAAQPDVVILDVMMPYMNGFEVAQRMRANRAISWTPILMLTGLQGVSKTVEGLEAGADDYLGKPYSGAELMARVRSLLRLKQLHKEMEYKADELERERSELQTRNVTLHRVLRRYVSQEIADLVLADPSRNMELGGAALPITVLHADLRHFTRYSTQHGPQEVLQCLNRIWEVLVPLIFEMHGTFDKYVGDAVISFYGAPISLGDDAQRAVHTAIAMQESFAALRASDPAVHEMGLAIGIATGDALVGNVGNKDVVDYTVIGVVPNIAERLQEKAKAGQILICSQTHAAVQNEIAARPLPPMALRGLDEPVAPHEVMGRRGGYKPSPHALLAKLMAGNR